MPNDNVIAAIERGSELDARTQRLLVGPIFPVLVRMAWPNILIMVAQASTGLIETWWVSKLGTDALAGMALAYPTVALTTMISSGAMGGGISSAVARALGANRRNDADALVLHALVINLALGLGFSAAFLLFGKPIYQAMGGQGEDLRAALIYSQIVFSGNIFIWLMNALASVIRGTGNIIFPAAVTMVGVLFLVPISPLLIFGFGPIPAMGIAGGAIALMLFYAAGSAVMGWHILSGRNIVRFRWVSLRWTPMREILRIGAMSAISSTLTNVIIGGATALVSSAASVDAVAGFGTGARLEYLLIPLCFGIGGPLVALVGANIGADQPERALQIGLLGGALAFALTETIGLGAAVWPGLWLRLFSANPNMLSVGSAYLRIVGPTYGLFGMGMTLYFASQGAGRLIWPTLAGFVRLAVALGAGWIALKLTQSVEAVFAAVALGLATYGIIILVAIRGGAWAPPSHRAA